MSTGETVKLTQLFYIFKLELVGTHVRTTAGTRPNSQAATPKKTLVRFFKNSHTVENPADVQLQPDRSKRVPKISVERAVVVRNLQDAPLQLEERKTADDELAEEGEEDGQHDRGVVEQVEPLVVGSPLEARVEAVLDVVQAEGIPSLLDSSLLFSFNSSRVPL